MPGTNITSATYPDYMYIHISIINYETLHIDVLYMCIVYVAYLFVKHSREHVVACMYSCSFKPWLLVVSTVTSPTVRWLHIS